MQLQLSTWADVEAYLTRSTGIIIPIGSTEQHGPNGFVGTDALCPEIVAAGVAEEVEVMVAPTIAVGMAQHHLAFPGSMTLRPSTLIAVIVDQINSLSLHGFDRFFFLNGHGGNIATASAAFSEIYAQSSLQASPSNQRPVRCQLKNWWQSDAIKALSAELFGDAEGGHATPSEVSLTYFGYPDNIPEATEMNPPIAPKGPIYDAADYRRRFADGRIGSNPGLATVEAGRRLFEASVADVVQTYNDFLIAD